MRFITDTRRLPFHALTRNALVLVIVSIFLVGPNAKVIAPSIISAWLSSSSELSAALALLQTAAVFIALIVLFRATRRYSGELL